MAKVQIPIQKTTIETVELSFPAYRKMGDDYFLIHSMNPDDNQRIALNKGAVIFVMNYVSENKIHDVLLNGTEIDQREYARVLRDATCALNDRLYV